MDDARKMDPWARRQLMAAADYCLLLAEELGAAKMDDTPRGLLEEFKRKAGAEGIPFLPKFFASIHMASAATRMVSVHEGDEGAQAVRDIRTRLKGGSFSANQVLEHAHIMFRDHVGHGDGKYPDRDDSLLDIPHHQVFIALREIHAWLMQRQPR